MSELRPTTPAQRPDNAQPRVDVEPTIEPPTRDELQRIERHLASLPGHSGAELSDSAELGALLVHVPGNGHGLNYAALPRWTSDGWRDSLDRVAREMRARGDWPSLLLADRLDRPSELAAELPKLGWQAMGWETALWVGRASVVPHLDPRLRIEAVLPRSVADHERVEREIFGLPERESLERSKALGHALEGGRLRAWIVRIGDEPVAVARLSQGEGVAGLYGIGVVEGRRRQGLGTLITTVATRAGMALGNRLVWLSVEDDNPGACAMYERLGFEPAFSWARWMALPQ
jgi:ribosomal protein S18 acetylase RimI-like enzyme